MTKITEFESEKIKDYSACGIRRIRILRMLEFVKNKEGIDAEELNLKCQIEFGIRDCLSKKLIELGIISKMLKVEKNNIFPVYENYPELIKPKTIKKYEKTEQDKEDEKNEN